MTIEEKYQDLCLKPSDIYQHLPTLKKYAAELERHCNKAKKFIAMHDTNLAGDPDRMRQAVNDFLDKHKEWEVSDGLRITTV